MKLIDFESKVNQGWLAFFSKKNLVRYGFRTERLAKFDENTNLLQVTIGSTVKGQRLNLNAEIETLMVALFPNKTIEQIPSTNGSSTKPSYPSFKVQVEELDLNDFLVKIQNLAIVRSKAFDNENNG